MMCWCGKKLTFSAKTTFSPHLCIFNPSNYLWFMIPDVKGTLTLVPYIRSSYNKHSLHFHLLTSSVGINPRSTPTHSGWYKALHDPIHMIVCLLGSNSSAQVQSLELSVTIKSQCLQYHSSRDAKSLSNPVHSKWNQFEHLSHWTIGFWQSLVCLQ